MKSNCRCPVCHNDLSLEAIFEDDAGRELVTILTKEATHGCARHLVSYLGLFRPAKSNLSHSRAVKLSREVLDELKPSRATAHALSETVSRIREKRAQGDTKPLTNHNYLKTVYETSKQLFAHTAKKEEEQKPHRDTQEAYFKQMESLGIDISTLNGGKEYLESRGKNNG